MSELPVLVTEEDLKRLPRRSIVAFAARCAQRVRPLYHSDDPKHVQAVDNAIAFAVKWANGEGIDADAFGVGADAAAAAADAAAAAADAAADDDPRAAAYAAAADDDARAAAEHADKRFRSYVHYVCYQDFVKLLDRSERAGTSAGELGEPVDVNTLGPLWLAGEPNWNPSESDKESSDLEPSPMDPSEGHALKITLDFPANFSDEQIQAEIHKLVAESSALHIALGGHGLTISDIKIFEGMPVPEEVPSG